MSEFEGIKPLSIDQRKPLTVENKCDSPFSVGTGFVFHHDGDYLVTVRGDRIIIETLRNGGEK